MEYILIFIAAVFVNNIVLAQFLESVRSWAYLKGLYGFRDDRSRNLRDDPGHPGYFYRPKDYPGSVRNRFYANHYFYSDHCSLGTNGRNHIEKGQSFALSGVRCVPALDHHQLCGTGSCHYGDPKDFNLLESLVFAASTAIGFGLALTILPVSVNTSNW